ARRSGCWPSRAPTRAPPARASGGHRTRAVVPCGGREPGGRHSQGSAAPALVKMQVAAQPVRLSVVIPTSDRSETLATTRERLRAQEDVGGLAEIVVVDNGSTDDTPQVLADAAEGPGLPVRWLREPRLGPAAARNAGVRAADGDLILFLGD